MGWRRQRGQDRSERPRRPKARRLTTEERDSLLAKMKRAIERSPVLSVLAVEVAVMRGRFYLERKDIHEDGTAATEALGRLTPLVDAKDPLLLEVAYGTGSWTEVAQGAVQKVMNTVANDTKGTFHGLGALNKALRQAGQGLQPLPVQQRPSFAFMYAATEASCTVQEALFHYYGVPIDIIAAPRDWYGSHRQPHLVEAAADRQRVLVRFIASSLSGSFGGICLYLCRDGQWGAYTIKPSERNDIASAERWLEKRKWRAWTERIGSLLPLHFG